MLPAAIRLVPSDNERYARFRRYMLAEAPWAFGATPEDDIALDLAYLESALAESENAIFAVEAPNGSGELAAVAGILRRKNPKFAHRARLWGVFVDRQYRGRGMGRVVVSAAIAFAKSWNGVAYIDLGVSANAPEALALYQSLGFIQWGREPETTQYHDMRYDEIFMALRIG